MWSLLSDFVVSPAWAADAFGIGNWFNLFVQSILIIIGGAVTLIFGWKGLRICLSRGLNDAVDEFVVMGAGIAVIVGGPAIARAAIPSASGLTLLPAGAVWSLSQDLGDTLGWFLTAWAMLGPWLLLWRWGHGRTA